MSVTAGDIEIRYSTTAGSQGDTEAGNAAGSLGKYISTTEINMSGGGNLVPNITPAQNEAGITLYRCWFVANTNVTDTWYGVLTWILSKTAGGATVSIGLDPTGVVDIDDTTEQAVEIANQETAPAGVTFSAPTGISAALEVGNVGPGKCFAVWSRVVVPPNTPTVSADIKQVRIYGATEAT